MSKDLSESCSVNSMAYYKSIKRENDHFDRPSVKEAPVERCYK